MCVYVHMYVHTGTYTHTQTYTYVYFFIEKSLDRYNQNLSRLLMGGISYVLIINFVSSLTDV